jgi:enoyl-CoA hydratase/carnithine racemase
VTSRPAGLDRAGLRYDPGQPCPGAATVTLSRPERRNAMTPRMWRGLAEIGRSLSPDIRVVVVRGEGPSFSSGIDLRILSGEEAEGADAIPSPADPGFEEWIAACQEGFAWLRKPSLISVAAVRGHAIGAGFQLALGCDLRVLADDAML